MIHALLLLVLNAAPPLTTVSEQSGFTRTGRFDEVEKLCAEFPKRYPGKVKCERFGTTPLGRPMLALVTQTTDAKKKPVIFTQAGIHAGEIDGKDAGFWVMREVLDGKIAPGVLSKLTWVFVPVFNVD
ncbi:MAG: peptidase M14, partial [Archangium sp.]|nr:peptidase M14 [Archangium sp.]